MASAPSPSAPTDPEASGSPLTDHQVADVFDRQCPSRSVLQDVTGRWGTLALIALVKEPARFNALRRRVDGVSEKMLAQTLQALERDGLVDRDVQAVIPPRVEYRLTPLGQRVADQMVGLVDVLEAAMPDISSAQLDYDER